MDYRVEPSNTPVSPLKCYQSFVEAITDTSKLYGHARSMVRSPELVLNSSVTMLGGRFERYLPYLSPKGRRGGYNSRPVGDFPLLKHRTCVLCS